MRIVSKLMRFDADSKTRDSSSGEEEEEMIKGSTNSPSPMVDKKSVYQVESSALYDTSIPDEMEDRLLADYSLAGTYDLHTPRLYTINMIT